MIISWMEALKVQHPVGYQPPPPFILQNSFDLFGPRKEIFLSLLYLVFDVLQKYMESFIVHLLIMIWLDILLQNCVY